MFWQLSAPTCPSYGKAAHWPNSRLCCRKENITCREGKATQWTSCSSTRPWSVWKRKTLVGKSPQFCFDPKPSLSFHTTFSRLYLDIQRLKSNAECKCELWYHICSIEYSRTVNIKIWNSASKIQLTVLCCLEAHIQRIITTQIKLEIILKINICSLTWFNIIKIQHFLCCQSVFASRFKRKPTENCSTTHFRVPTHQLRTTRFKFLRADKGE